MMTARILTFLMVLLPAVSCMAEPAAAFEYGPRPPHSVFDPGGLLDPLEMKQLADPLAKIKKEEAVDVIVVILADLEGAPPEHVAKQFAAEWCDSQIHAVVLHVPGREDSPWIVPEGKLVECVKSEILRQDVADAKRRSSLEPTEAGKVRAAATEAADKLRFWMATAINRSVLLEKARNEIRAEHERKARHWRVAMLTSAASAIPILCGLAALFFVFRKPGSRRFPETNPPRRRGAPHAGGNHAVAHLGTSPKTKR